METMKNYYYNPKTQDLLIFDTEGNEILVLERMTGIRVFTSSELKDPAPVSHDQDFNQEAPVKVYKKYVAKDKKRKPPTCSKCGEKGHRSHLCPNGKSGGKKGGKWKCKNCGELGHSAKTCTKPAVAPAAPSEELPANEIDKIAREERHEETPGA